MMVSAFLLIVYTANILGSFSDPFEFEGDYGAKMNPIRQQVFERVVPREALTKHLTDSEIRQRMEKEDASANEIQIYRDILITQAIEEDTQHGPTLGELVSSELISDIKNQQQNLRSFSDSELRDLLHFVEHYGDKKIFRFLHNTPSGFLSLDKTLPDMAAQEGRDFSLPLLSSTARLIGENSYELKRDLLQAIFTEKTLHLTKSEETLLRSLKKFDRDFLQEILGSEVEIEDLQVFCTPSGQAFMYWLYHSLNLHLISQDKNMIDDVNLVKKLFAQTLGNPEQRAQSFKEKLLDTDAGVLFTQESDDFTRQALVEDELFLPVHEQNPKDGCFIFLRSDIWQPTYEILSIDGYEGFQKGRINLILATMHTGEKFLLASAHGNSTNAEDGRLQVTLIMDAFRQLKQERGYGDLQLLIGMDANTKTESDVIALQQHLSNLGLVGTNVGPTTVKRRMMTVQHSKAGKLSIDEEDYLITLQREYGGKYLLADPTVGFNQELSDLTRMLPDVDNPSDHYPVGASLRAM